VTPFEAWLLQVEDLLGRWEPSCAAELDDLVERGLDITETGAHIEAPVGSREHARLQQALDRVTVGLTTRRDEVGDELDALARQRFDLTRNASGIAGYLAADALSPTG
jgi:hypothetical protein